jgi:predicted RNA-binding Zn-ribbon protein involved in translation (DUF1610 family)
MRAPTPARLLQVWEQGSDRSVAARVLLLLAAALDDDVDGMQVDDLAALPIGQRDALLLELHAQLFGEEIVGLAHCPHCGAQVEAAFDCAALLSARTPGRVVDVVQAGDIALRFRLPDSNDLLAIAHCRDPEHAHETLLARCVIDATREGVPCASERLPEDVATALSRAMAAADPLADVRLSFTCPACGNPWETGLDPARFLWRELQAWAVRMLREVDALARAYHWSEADILALGTRRRQEYLALCAQ